MAKQKASSTSGAAKPRSRRQQENTIAVAQDFVKSHVEKKLIRSGMDPELAQDCLTEIDAETLQAIAEECGYEPEGHQSHGDEEESQAEGQDEGGEDQEAQPKRGVAAIGDDPSTRSSQANSGQNT